jgi:hypothetical protein
VAKGCNNLLTVIYKTMQSLTASLWIALESYVRALWNTPIMARFRGAFTALFGVSSLISFLSYHADDPSLNVVSDSPVRNVLGRRLAIGSAYGLFWFNAHPIA